MSNMNFILDQIPGISSLSPEWRKVVDEKAVQIFRAADWACGAKDVREIIRDHTSFFAGECVFLFLAFFTFIHAFRKGGRYMYMWIGVVLHCLNTELIAYLVPDVDNFWHAQGFLTLFGRRMPLYILALYPVFDYTSAVAARRMHLPWWAMAPATGLFTVLMDMPYDIMGVKLLWWTWADTDPNVADRMYWVPWTSYYFHAAFAASFQFLLLGSRRLLLPVEYDWKLFPREILCIVIAAGGAFWLGALQFIPIYHLFHDNLGVPTECCAMAFLATYAYIVWIADRRAPVTSRPKARRLWFDELALVVSLHYIFYMGLVVFADDPASIKSTGLHEPLGPCGQWVDVQTVSGMVLKKQKYLCPSSYDEPYFDFHCLEGRKPPALPDGGKGTLEWYTICGTPYPNHAEYIFVVWAACLFGAAVLFQIEALGFSGETPMDPVKQYKRKRE